MNAAKAGLSASILIVEDDPQLARATSRVLTTMGYRILLAGDGRQALDALLASQHLPALILSNWDMPVMSGKQLVLALKRVERLAGIPIMIISGTSGLRSTRDYLVLRKPVSAKQLCGVVLDVLSLPQRGAVDSGGAGLSS